MYYKKNPESHPDYNSEWKLFWEHRYQQLASSGANPNNHDFKSEWVVFWNDRMKDIFRSAVEAKRSALMGKHRISCEDLEEKRPPSPWEDEDNSTSKPTTLKYSVLDALYGLKKVESRLGTFGPAIKTLIVKAESARSRALEIFFDKDNFTLIKLTQDKLKCSLNDIKEPLLINQVTESIAYCKWLMNEVDSKKTAEEYLGLNIDEISSKTIGMDTVQIAQQIALSLLKVGKANVSEDDLQRILLAVSAAHAKQMLDNKQTHQSNNGDGHVTSTTSTFEGNNGKTLFPSANPPPKTKSLKNETQDDKNSAAAGALGQLMSAYEEDENPKDMDKLSLEDLVNLLSNFKDLSKEEQKALTTYLKKLEATDSRKVTKLREMVQQNMKAIASKPKQPETINEDDNITKSDEKDSNSKESIVRDDASVVQPPTDNAEVSNPPLPVSSQFSQLGQREIRPDNELRGPGFDEPHRNDPHFERFGPGHERAPGFDPGDVGRGRPEYPDRFPPRPDGYTDYQDRPGSRERHLYDRRDFRIDDDMRNRPIHERQDGPPPALDRFNPRDGPSVNDRMDLRDDPYYGRPRLDHLPSDRRLDYERDRMYQNDREYMPRDPYADDRFRSRSPPRLMRPGSDYYDRPSYQRDRDMPPYHGGDINDFPPRRGGDMPLNRDGNILHPRGGRDGPRLQRDNMPAHLVDSDAQMFPERGGIYPPLHGRDEAMSPQQRGGNMPPQQYRDDVPPQQFGRNVPSQQYGPPQNQQRGGPPMSRGPPFDNRPQRGGYFNR